MDDKPVVQIVLPPMPNPKDFSMATGNPCNDMGLFQLSLNSWEKVSLAAVQAFGAQHGDSGAVRLLPPKPDRTKN